MPGMQARVFGSALLFAAVSCGPVVTDTEAGAVAAVDIGSVAESLAWASEAGAAASSPPKDRRTPLVPANGGSSSGIAGIILNGARKGGDGSEASNCPAGAPNDTLRTCSFSQPR